MKFSWRGIEWNGGSCYLYWWNILPKGHRYFGPYYIWHDGPHKSFGFWFCNIAWFFFNSSWKDEWTYQRPWIDDWKWMDKE